MFFDFLNRRYYPEKIYSNGCLEKYHSQDIKCFIDVKERFEREINSLSPIKKYNIGNDIIFLKELIDKLKKLEQEE